MSAAPIRFGIMVNGPELQAWQLRCIEGVLALPGAKLSLVIVNGARRDAASLKDRLSRVPPRHALFALMCRLFVNPPAARRTAWHDRLPETAELVCTPIRKGRFSEHFAEPDIAAIRAHDLDFVLRFGFGIIRGEVLRVPRYGVWSFHHDDERKWLFHTDREAGSCERLYIRFADALEGPWLPHAQNPVKIDIRSARPGGTPFLRDGHLYRPAQDCAETYGARIRLHRIDVLSPTEFSEEEVAVIAPDPDGPYPDGLHTASGDGGFTVVDGKREGFIWQAFVGATRRRVAALAAR